MNTENIYTYICTYIWILYPCVYHIIIWRTLYYIFLTVVMILLQITNFNVVEGQCYDSPAAAAALMRTGCTAVKWSPSYLRFSFGCFMITRINCRRQFHWGKLHFNTRPRRRPLNNWLPFTGPFLLIYIYNSGTVWQEHGGDVVLWIRATFVLSERVSERERVREREWEREWDGLVCWCRLLGFDSKKTSLSADAKRKLPINHWRGVYDPKVWIYCEPAAEAR
jgi:hypothetical protein